jgi:Fic family protein
MAPLVRCALVHAQFETIHPFGDGNGRTGRALLQLVLRRRGLCRRFVPPISLVLATWSKRCVAALMGTRVDAAAGSEVEAAGLQGWIEVAAQAARVACEQAHAYEAQVAALVAGWRDQLTGKIGTPRADAAVWVLLDLLPAAPLVTAQTAVGLTGRSERAIDGAIAQLVEAGVLKQVGGRARYRLYEAVGVFDLVTDAERALASPERDTRISAPVRATPARRKR